VTKVEIEETMRKSGVVSKDGRLYEFIIYLPLSFIDFENKDSRDAIKETLL
jgi:hypothetical protein